MAPKPRPEIDRFNEKIAHASSGCIEWTGAKDGKGYGKIQCVRNGKRKLVQAHIWAYEHYVGPAPEGMHLDHLCRNRKCVNTDHLEPVTHRENILRGVGPTAVNAQKTRCPAGHLYDAANTYVSKSGSRLCRACRREHDRQRQAARTVYMRQYRTRTGAQVVATEGNS